MDPLSITVSCLALISAATKTTTSVSKFVRVFRDARQDLAAISRQLGELQMILELLRSENDGEDEDETGPIQPALSLPDTVKSQICSILSNCAEIFAQLDSVMSKHIDGRATSARWAVKGKSEVASLGKQLDAHMRALNIALELSQL